MSDAPETDDLQKIMPVGTVWYNHASRLEQDNAWLRAEMKRRHDEYAKALNRRCSVEDALYAAAKGIEKGGEPLTAAECRALAIKLGVSPE